MSEELGKPPIFPNCVTSKYIEYLYEIMPAIQLARLKIQVTTLLSYYEQPDEFLNEFHLLLGFYADRTRRQGQSGKPKPLVQAYNVPKQVMRRIKGDISQLVIEKPKNAITLADLLWNERWFECQSLSINILGLLPLDDQRKVIDRLHSWGKDCRDDRLLDALLEDGAARIREESPNDYQDLVEEWLSGSDTSSHKLGLRALPALILNPTFENLPVIFRILGPLIRESESAVETDLMRVIRALGNRSPHETAFFLQQNLIAPHRSALPVIVRKSMDIFPPDIQESLKVILREQMRTGSINNT